MKMYYNHLENNELLFNLEQNKLFCQVLVYTVTFKKCNSFTVIAHPHAIEVRANHIRIFILLYVGFEKHEFIQYAHKPNVHIVSFSRCIMNMHEFQAILNQIKFITPYTLFFTALDVAPDDTPIRDLSFLLHLK